MKLTMFIFAVCLILVLIACEKGGDSGATIPVSASAGAVGTASGGGADSERSLDELAEIERSGLYRPGLALRESGLRESAGDFAGAVLAAYKELAFMYGRGLVKKDVLETGLLNVAALGEKNGNSGTEVAAEGVLAFARERWDEALGILREFFDEGDDPDSFARWMILCCLLEKNPGDRAAAAAYRSIRARYAQFPEYWYRGARTFPGLIGAEYAEYCIGLAPEGPFAAECRNILALNAGLKAEDGSSLKSKSEIEDIISRSVGQGDPELLVSLIPLISLPDNPYTVYAVGAMRALVSIPEFRDFLNTQAAVSRGRLAERLAYICRG